MSDRTTVEMTKENRDALKAERLPHESTYDETIERLLGNADNPYPDTEDFERLKSSVNTIEDRLNKIENQLDTMAQL